MVYSETKRNIIYKIYIKVSAPRGTPPGGPEGGPPAGLNNKKKNYLYVKDIVRSIMKMMVCYSY